MFALEINDLKKTYKGGFVALKGISLSIKKGDFFALLGPNGAGKSTTINIVTHLVNKDSGTIKVFGCDVDKDFSRAKQYIGVVPQEFNFGIFEKVIDIITTQAGYYNIARKDALVRAESVLKQLDLWDKRNSAARTLSGGMKRRLMIARALVHKPQLLILDEPTAGVDIEVRRSMWTFIQEINKQGITIILTTHYLEEAENLCKNIAIINDGAIVENTSMKKLLNTLTEQTFILDIVAQKKRLNKKNVVYRDDSTIEVTVNKTEGINKMFRDLDKEGITITSMRNKTNRLEELFMGRTR